MSVQSPLSQEWTLTLDVLPDNIWDLLHLIERVIQIQEQASWVEIRWMFRHFLSTKYSRRQELQR